MSLKKDDSGRRWVQAAVEVPGTPEEVWAAIATGPGVSSWFVPTEKRDDGTVVSHFGPGMDVIATETAWDPPHRFAAESEFGPGAPKMATEWSVEARSGGKCVVRVVHSLFASTDDWDNQLENIENGWPDYFLILKLYLTYFRGLPCSAFQLMTTSSETADRVWKALSESLGLEESTQGEHRKAPAGMVRLAGFIEQVGSAGHPHQLLVRLDEPTAGIMHMIALGWGNQAIVSIRFYLYGDKAAGTVASEEHIWQSWLNALFPTAGTPISPC